MHPTALLDLATELLRALSKLDAPADGIVSAFFRKHRNLGIRERHALAETAYAVLRRRPLYQHLAQSGHGALERRLAILAWQGQDSLLRGALGPSELTWRNQVQALDSAGFSEKLRHNLPDWLSGALRAQLGDEEFWALVTALDAQAPLDLRVNTLKLRRDQAQQSLADAGIDAQPTPHSPWGLRIHGKPALNKLPIFIGGGVEVQDEGSQLLVSLLDAKRGEMVVDFCAGAGGKTLAIGAAMRSTGRLYAFDVSGHRLEALKPRLKRSGLSNVHPAQIAHERDDRIKRLAGKIDRVLVDAPCSGLGTLRRNPDLKWRQSPQAVAELQAKQRAILDSAARLLKPGGRLVYATCSLLTDENEQVAGAFAEGHTDFVPLQARELLERAQVEGAAALDQGGYLRLWPHRHSTDGFFAAAWERR
ncbi:RsmB/NOP family class I SAM-dependent RNA methyltransferase [Aquincola sp. S2]|uniref:RsmB/NOP family class I SAM-dependent RNA methyltransferase n=1 Tax=Pseudaquabacterium terrae TaxID=2732868 RepID=A0ABX2EHD9_9BURK|nr:RsmB/NOP family class I SAM-dependent RNA methyltransferase [Aquabacterium terrae]NRF68037.1 RsmB/NOP family class I SAM-dependent RNA methyltransferase [Aquabacterium terrae]